MFSLKKIIVLFFIFKVLGLGAQNLVPNPSFETYTACPTAPSQLGNAVPWKGTNNQSDYYNACASMPYNVPYEGVGFQYARTGNAFAGQWFLNGYGVNYREYMQVQLTNTLVTGQCYLVKFYVNNQGAGLKLANNNFAAHVSMNGYATTGSPATSYTPQIFLTNNPIIKDSLNWREIGGIYTAIGGEEFITIGNFKNDSNTDTIWTNYGTYGGGYYLVDDVSLEQITTPQWQLKDTMILGGDSVLIGPLYSGLTCNWFDMFGSPIGSGSAFWVKPTTTTSYVLQQNFCNNTFSDTVTVFVSAIGINENKKISKITIFPNPATSSLYFVTSEKSIENGSIVISNMLGQEIFMLQYRNEIDVSQFLNGCYFLNIITTEKQQFHSKFIKE